MKIELDIPADLVQQLGEQALREWVAQQMEYLRFSFLELEVQQGLINTNVEWEMEFEKVKQNLWDTYQRTYLPKAS